MASVVLNGGDRNMPDDQPPPNEPAATPSGKITRASVYVVSQLADAMTLSGYAVSAGIHTPSGEPLPFGDIGVIQGTAAKLGVFDPPLDGQGPSFSVTASEWIAFEQAYYRLAVAMTPVTAETLAATQATMPGAGGISNLRDRIFGYSPALRFTRWFALVTIAIGAFVIIAECLIYVLGMETDATKYIWQKNFLESLVPWAYGALGSCAFLLRSAHYFIYQRSFDLRRKPEYFNRVLLGAISGGAIILSRSRRWHRAAPEFGCAGLRRGLQHRFPVQHHRACLSPRSFRKRTAIPRRNRKGVKGSAESRRRPHLRPRQVVAIRRTTLATEPVKTAMAPSRAGRAGRQGRGQDLPAGRTRPAVRRIRIDAAGNSWRGWIGRLAPDGTAARPTTAVGFWADRRGHPR